MAQVGLNMGPRDARVFGWAKSYTKNLDIGSKVAHDTDVIGGVSLLWIAAKAYLPVEITRGIERVLDEAELPKIATKNVPQGILNSFSS